eukprot:scaffold34938_cov53-Attheya_sp.AAC.7
MGKRFHPVEFGIENLFRRRPTRVAWPSFWVDLLVAADLWMITFAIVPWHRTRDNESNPGGGSRPIIIIVLPCAVHNPDAPGPQWRWKYRDNSTNRG